MKLPNYPCHISSGTNGCIENSGLCIFFLIRSPDRVMCCTFFIFILFYFLFWNSSSPVDCKMGFFAAHSDPIGSLLVFNEIQPIFRSFYRNWKVWRKHKFILQIHSLITYFIFQCSLKKMHFNLYFFDSASIKIHINFRINFSHEKSQFVQQTMGYG